MSNPGDFVVQDGVLTQYKGLGGDVILPDGVREIGKSVFEGNKSVVSVSMPDSVRSIGAGAFKKCAKLKSVTFSNVLESIDFDAFQDCKALKTLDLPNTLRQLGSGVFAGCTKLTKISCDSAVLQMGSNPFADFRTTPCTQLADERGFLIFCGILYDYYGKEEEIQIPDGVRAIVPAAFQSGIYSWENIRNITTVVIPDSVREIGHMAFANCRKLRSLRMGEGVKLGKDVFRGCSALADENGFVVINGTAVAYTGERLQVQVTQGIAELAPELMRGRKMQSVTLPEGLKRIGNAAFADCVELREVMLPESLKTIGAEAFGNCGMLAAIRLPEGLENLGENAFSGCRGLADEEGFAVIGNTLYGYYGAERELQISEGITAIEDGAFRKLGLKTVKLPSGLKRLGAAFTGCSMLTEIALPEGIRQIARDCFNGCSRLEKISLPQSLETIGNDAFLGCEQLRKIEIPEKVTELGNTAFAGCRSLEEVRIPEGVQALKSWSFRDCMMLKSVTLPESLRKIGGECFKGCVSLETVRLPEGMEDIEYSAFENCVRLKRVECKEPPRRISRNAFDGCGALADENGLICIGSLLLKSLDGFADVTVPEGIRAIAGNAFREGWIGSPRRGYFAKRSGTLRSIRLPSTLRGIGEGAFAGCEGLERIELPEGLKVLGKECFLECTGLREIRIPDTVTMLGEGAFRGCVNLKSAVLSESLTRLETETFQDCSSLKTMELPRSLAELGSDVWRSCYALESISTAEDNRHFSCEDGVLYNKEGNSLLLVPAGKKRKAFAFLPRVRTIGRHALLDCGALQKISIPETVENIGDEAFPRKKIRDIQVALGAGSGKIGENILDLWEFDRALVYPQIPVDFVKEQATQNCLCLGFCKEPDKYAGDYAEGYRKYAQSHQRTLLKRVQPADRKAVEQYFAALPENREKAKDETYHPDLKQKRASALKKVEILEEAVLKGTPEDLKAVLETYPDVEFTARALGLACRYRGMAHVEELLRHGVSFRYDVQAGCAMKYGAVQKTAAGLYRTEYYLMLVPRSLRGAFYGPMCGISALKLPEGQEKKLLPAEERLAITRALEERNVGLSLDEMLFWAICHGEPEFADKLMEMGADLRRTPPGYYHCWARNTQTYLEIITEGKQGLFWNSYVEKLCALHSEQVLPALRRLNDLAARAGKKLAMSQKLFDELKWDNRSLDFAVGQMDLSKVNQKKILETAVTQNSVQSLENLAKAGWIDQPAKRDGLIAFAQESGRNEALAWLLDYKNKTADLAAEQEKEEAKLMRELNEKPDSVSALKRIWSYKKQEDGSLIITSYKGSETEVLIPAVIGKARVSVIGEEAFSASEWNNGVKNREARRKIVSVTVPEGVERIDEAAFSQCVSLKTVKLPQSLRLIGDRAFRDCEKLKSIQIPEGVSTVGAAVFWGCKSLPKQGDFLVLSGTVYRYDGKDSCLRFPEGVRAIHSLSTGNGTIRGFDPYSQVRELFFPESLESIGNSVFEKYKGLNAVTLPKGLRKIGRKAFAGSGLKSVELNEGLEQIGDEAFAATALETVRIPQSVQRIGRQAFYGCSRLKEFSIPGTIESLGEEILGDYDGRGSRNVPRGVYVYTPAGSETAEYMKRYGGCIPVSGEDK